MTRFPQDGVKERFVDERGGVGGKDTDALFHIVREQDCQGIIDAIKAAPSYMARKKPSTQDSQRWVGSVPNLMAVQWAKEWGVKLYSKEWVALAGKRLKTDPNWKQLRVTR